MRQWSEQQQNIFKWFQGSNQNLIVRARAGTGKTTTIIEGISQAPDKKILLVAFNKTIATELQQRILNPNAEAKTLHALGFGFIGSQIKVKVDNDRGLRIAKAVLDKSMPLNIHLLVKKLASLAKNACPNLEFDCVSELAYEHDCIPDTEVNIKVHELVECAIKACELASQDDGTIDFDDMIFMPIKQGWIQKRWDLVVVDEAQDMNASQLLLAQGACKTRIAVVGDDRQAIYGFRGADSGAIDRLKYELKATEMGLTVTYRCAKSIVTYAQSLVPDFQYAPHAIDGLINGVELKDLAAAAKPGDFILSRKNAPLASVCLSLIRAGTPAKISGKDIAKQLLNLMNRWKDKGIVKFLEQLTKWQKSEIEKAQTYPENKREGKILAINDQAETIRALAEGVNELRELRARIENMFVDENQNPLGCVLCSSIHKSKGQERNRVFVLRDTLYARSKNSQEEKNLEYVAVTRAMKQLIWVNGSY